MRTAKEMTQERLVVECARIGYYLPRATLGKIEAGIRAVSDVELFVLAHALGVEVSELFPKGLLKLLRDGRIAPFHVRENEKSKRKRE